MVKALLKVAARFIPNANDLRNFNGTVEGCSPSIITHSHANFEGDFVSAVVGSQVDDPDGRLVYQIARRISFRRALLAMAFNRVIERYQMTAEQLMELLASSPLFDDAEKACSPKALRRR